jgi:dGTPase
VVSSLSEIKVRKIQTVDDVRAQQTDTLGFSKAVRRQERELRRFLFSNFYTHYKVHRMRNRARIFITGLFDEFTNNPKLLPPRFQDRAEAGGVSRAVADYIAGMTDPYAEREYQRLFNPFEGV